MNLAKVAVVILNWNGVDFLRKFLPDVEKYSSDENTEIWIADNGSTDSSVEYLKENHSDVKLLVLDKNYGFTGGYNRALEQIKAEYFVLLNSDVEVTENWITPIIEYMDKNPEVAAVQPKILAYHDKTKFEHAGAAGGFIDKYGYPFCRGRILDNLETDDSQYNDIKEIFWATGACFFIRSEDFLSEKFDEDFFAHMEEIDLCWRLKNKNRKIVYHPDSVVYHVGGGTLSTTSPRKLFLNYRNNLLVLYKNLHKKKFFKILIFRMILDGISAIIYLLKFQFSSFYTVLKAHFAFYGKMHAFRSKRKSLKNRNKLTLEGIYPKSIVFDYFVRKKRKFTNLNF